MKFHTLHRLKFCDQSGFIRNKMGCFNDPAWKVCGWVVVADTNYLYPARWGWINNFPVDPKDYIDITIFLKKLEIEHSKWKDSTEGQGFFLS